MAKLTPKNNVIIPKTYNTSMIMSSVFYYYSLYIYFAFPDVLFGLSYQKIFQPKRKVLQHLN